MHCGGTCEAREKEVRFCLELWNKYPPSIYKDLKRGALRAQEILEKLRVLAHRASGGWARAAILLAGGLDAGLLHSLNHTSSAKTTMPRQARTNRSIDALGNELRIDSGVVENLSTNRRNTVDNASFCEFWRKT